MDKSQPYEALDPENWNDMRALAHRMVDDALTYLETVRERLVWQQMPDDVIAHFNEQVPHQPVGADAAYQEFVENILPYPMGTIHLRLAGIERADSVALDLHKWLHIPFEAGCVIIRSDKDHRSTFSLTPEYLAHESRGLAAGHWFSDYGLQLSRQFRALKVWMSIKEHGLDRFGRRIDRNVEQAHYLGTLIKNEPKLELMAPIGIDIVCFRFNPGNMTDEALSALNKEILMQLYEQGIAAPSYTTLQGNYCIRVAIANHRSRQEDFDVLVQEIVRIGRELTAAKIS